MYIKIFIEEEYCVTAIAHALFYNEKIKSKQAFKTAVHDYLNSYGSLCLDDHESEYSDFKLKAESIVQKYYL